MISKKIVTSAGLMLLMTLAQSVAAQTAVQFLNATPATDAMDIAYLTASADAATNVDAGADSANYLAHDQNTWGQSFTTGADPNGYRLKGFALQHVAYGGSWWDVDNINTIFTIRVHEVSGTTLTPIYSTTYRFKGSETRGVMNGAGSGVNGTGNWIQIVFSEFDNIVLAPGTQYAVDVTPGNGTWYFETAGTNVDGLAGGQAYATNSDLALDMGKAYTGDHTFIADLEPAGLNISNSDLGWRHVDEAGATSINVVLENPNSVDATISGISISKGSFTGDALTVNATATPFTLSAGSTTVLSIDWTPDSTLGSRNFGLTVNSDLPQTVLSADVSAGVYPTTLAQWSFEGGTAGTDVQGTTQSTVYNLGIPDVSGMGNHMLDYWNAGSAQSIAYNSNVPPVVTGPNLLSGDSIGAGFPALFTWSEAAPTSPVVDLEAVVLRNFTLEAFFRAETLGGFRTLIGRDGLVAPGLAAPLYFGVNGSSIPKVEYADQAGGFHQALASAPLVTNNWYYMAGVLDQDSTTPTLSLYLANLTASESAATLVAQIELTGSNLDFGPHPKGDGSSSDDNAWTLFRGMYNVGHGDRWIGNIDEVRISGVALDPNAEGLLAVGVPVELSTFELE